MYKRTIGSLLSFMFGFSGLITWVTWGIIGLVMICATEKDINGSFMITCFWSFGVLCTLLFAMAPFRFFDVTVGLLLPSALEQMTSFTVIWNAIGNGVGFFGKLIICTICAGILLIVQIIKTWFMRDFAQKAKY